jgi:DNA-binding Xre family transcriptional regulator
MKKQSRHVGSSLDDFLTEEGILQDVEARAIKRVIAWQLDDSMKRAKLTKADLAKQMGTSRSALDRLLDPDNPSLTLGSLAKIAAVLGKRVRVQLVDGRSAQPARRRVKRRAAA